jgi:hypothetical protein
MTGTPTARKAGKPSDSTPDPDRCRQRLPGEPTTPQCGAIGFPACAALFLTGAMLAGAFSPGALAGPGGIGSAATVGVPGAGLIRVSSGFEVADASGPAGTPLPLRIALPENAAEAYSFLMFRKLPANFELSSGFGATTYWAVSLHDAGKLRIVPPADFAGSFELEVLLVKAIGSDPERRLVNVEFTPSRATVTAADPAGSGKLRTAIAPSEATAALPQASPQGGEDGARPLPAKEMTQAQRALMVRGDRYLNRGDVAAARLVYHNLARQNFADAALALARTYDPEILSALAVRGLRPDIAEARVWYEKARDLGSAPAAQRLATLNALGF